MRAEDTLQYMTDFCPILIPTRKHALNDLFCVVGNGYDWVNGELVNDDNRYVKRYKLRKPIEKAEFRYEQDWLDMNKFYRELYEDTNKKIPFKYDFEWYPLSKTYSYLFNYPDDIKDDWRALLEECKQLLIEDGIDLENVED